MLVCVHSYYIGAFVFSSLLISIISAAAVVPAAEDHREGPHTLEQEREHALPQVCNSIFLAAQCGTSLFCFDDFYAAKVKVHVLNNQLM